MSISKKIKDFFNRIFNNTDTKLLEEGNEIDYNSNNGIKSSLFKDSIKEQNNAEWKEPGGYKQSVIMYNGMDLSFVPLIDKPPIMTKDNFDFDGANRYTLKNKEYDLIRRITSMTVDTVGMLALDSTFEDEFNKRGSFIRLLFNTSSYFHDKGDDERAVEDLDNLLNNMVDFRNDMIQKEKERKEKKEETMEK